MARNTWIGGDSNNANNASGWSQGEVPMPGDDLDIQGGTINIRGNDLAGNTLVVNALRTSTETTTLNLSHHANVSLDVPAYLTGQVIVNVRGTDTLDLKAEYPGGYLLTANLADHATLNLNSSFGPVAGRIVVNGGDGSRLLDNGSSVFQGAVVILDANVKGTGSISDDTQYGVSGHLEFGGSVSHGQTVEVSGDARFHVPSFLTVDQPDTFKGSVVLNEFAQVNLLGLTGVDSYQLKNDLLSIYSGREVIEKLRLSTPDSLSGSTTNITVAQTSTGISIDRGLVNNDGTLLPVHQL